MFSMRKPLRGSSLLRALTIDSSLVFHSVSSLTRYLGALCALAMFSQVPRAVRPMHREVRLALRASGPLLYAVRGTLQPPPLRREML